MVGMQTSLSIQPEKGDQAFFQQFDQVIQLMESGSFIAVADKKGILTEWHNDTGDDGFWGNRYDDAQDDPEDIYPYEFITVLIQYIYNQDEALAMDLDCMEAVWNHPLRVFRRRWLLPENDRIFLAAASGPGPAWGAP
jgi:hypothetical protein